MLISTSSSTGNYTYGWYNDQSNLISTTAQVYNLSAGNYTVSVSDENGCSSTEELTVNSLGSEFNLDFSSDQTTGNIPLTVTFYNNSENLNNYNFNWDFGDGTTSQENSNVVYHTYYSAGTWDVTLTAQELSLIHI